MNIYLIRHGQTDWNKQGKIQGHLDIPLNQQGRLQAKILATKLKDKEINMIYSSDLSRAYQTAEIIHSTTNSRLISESRLRERNYGDWQQLSWAEVHAQNPHVKSEWKTNPLDSKPPQGESIQELYKRVNLFFSGVLKTEANNVLIVAHNSPLRIIISIAKGLALEDLSTIDHLSNTEIIQIQYTEGILQINENEFDKISLHKAKLAFQEQIV